MRTMRRAKGVVNIEIKTCNQFGNETGVIGFFTRVKSQILEQFHTRCELC
jgi:hypothetical protein